jgi:hypothetical protein
VKLNLTACAKIKATTAQPVSVPRQPSAFLIADGDQSTCVTAEDAVFFDEVGHGLPVPLVEPADERCQEPSKERRVEHGGKSIPRADLGGSEDRRPSNETLRAQCH